MILTRYWQCASFPSIDVFSPPRVQVLAEAWEEWLSSLLPLPDSAPVFLHPSCFRPPPTSHTPQGSGAG